MNSQHGGSWKRERCLIRRLLGDYYWAGNWQRKKYMKMIILILRAEWVIQNNRLISDDGSVYYKRNLWELRNRTKMETVGM